MAPFLNDNVVYLKFTNFIGSKKSLPFIISKCRWGPVE